MGDRWNRPHLAPAVLQGDARASVMQGLRDSIELRFKADAVLVQHSRAIYFGTEERKKSPPYITVAWTREPLHTFDADIFRYDVAFRVVTGDIRGVDTLEIVEDLMRVFGEARLISTEFHPAVMLFTSSSGANLDGDEPYTAEVTFELMAQRYVNNPLVRAI